MPLFLLGVFYMALWWAAWIWIQVWDWKFWVIAGLAHMVAGLGILVWGFLQPPWR